MNADDYNDGYSMFEQMYRCYPVSCIEKIHLEKGDKVIMPPSALDRLAYTQIDYPMLFELSHLSSGKVTHCGVLEFTADEGLIYLPSWIMESMLIQEGDFVLIKNASLSKGTYVKLQPHSKDFLDISNPKAVLETELRNFSCLTTGGTIMLAYNNKKFYIDILETKPSPAVCVIETDCEVDFAPPLDYEEPEKPAKSANGTRPDVDEEPEKKILNFGPFTGSARRLDGKPSTQLVEPVSSPALKQHHPSNGCKTNGTATSSSTKQQPGTLIFGSNASNQKQKASPKDSTQDTPQKEEEKKFKAFTGKKYFLNA